MTETTIPNVGDELIIAEETWTITEITETDDGQLKLTLEIV